MCVECHFNRRRINDTLDDQCLTERTRHSYSSTMTRHLISSPRFRAVFVMSRTWRIQRRLRQHTPIAPSRKACNPEVGRNKPLPLSGLQPTRPSTPSSFSPLPHLRVAGVSAFPLPSPISLSERGAEGAGAKLPAPLSLGLLRPGYDRKSVRILLVKMTVTAIVPAMSPR